MLLSLVSLCFFFQAEDGIRDLVRSRGLGDVYKRQGVKIEGCTWMHCHQLVPPVYPTPLYESILAFLITCLLYTSDAADERSSVDLGGRRIIKKKNNDDNGRTQSDIKTVHENDTIQDI